jgi:adenosyl cobinamide kinase/adenosyl cobinamide phosphate guanylyltransferase
VTVIATAEPRDDEMAERIARHRVERPAEWEIIEEPLALAVALTKPDPTHGAIVDCLTLWTSNLLETGAPDDAIFASASEAASIASGRAAPVIAITNEVGLGIVPTNATARRYRDVLGRVNAAFAGVAAHAYLVVAGRLLELHDATTLPNDR